MSKAKTLYRCAACAGATPRWLGRCPSCEAWNTLVEERVAPAATTAAGVAPTSRATPIADVDVGAYAARSTGVGELDRVLGGGLVPGSVTLLGGEPGIGKSTLLLQALAAMATTGARCLLVTGEESAQQVRSRADRLEAVRRDLWLVSETSLPDVVAHIDELQPDVVVVDSIQTMHDPELGSAPGSVGQVRECAHRLVREAKDRGTTVVLVGHVTKEGGLAGPRVLEHVVDTVLSFEGDRHHAIRLLRAVKHRFGGTQELGLFEMTEAGLAGVPDAGGLFLTDRRPGVPGSVVAPVMEGNRPLLVEIQGLVGKTPLPHPRRSAQGLDANRLAIILAVLERHLHLQLGPLDVYASAVGGVKVTEPGADLAVALALASAHAQRPLPGNLVACGEVGLGGELRQVAQTQRRLAEAVRLGFTEAVVPWSAPDAPEGLTVHRVATLMDAVQLASVR